MVSSFSGKCRNDAVYSTLGSSIRNTVDTTGSNGGHIDDRSATITNEDGERRAAHPQSGEEASVDFLLDLFLAVFLKRLRPDGATHIVDHNI